MVKSHAKKIAWNLCRILEPWVGYGSKSLVAPTNRNYTPNKNWQPKLPAEWWFGRIHFLAGWGSAYGQGRLLMSFFGFGEAWTGFPSYGHKLPRNRPRIQNLRWNEKNESKKKWGFQWCFLNTVTGPSPLILRSLNQPVELHSNCITYPENSFQFRFVPLAFKHWFFHTTNGTWIVCCRYFEKTSRLIIPKQHYIIPENHVWHVSYLPLFTYMYDKLKTNVGKYSLHAWYGYNGTYFPRRWFLFKPKLPQKCIQYICEATLFLPTFLASTQASSIFQEIPLGSKCWSLESTPFVWLREVWELFSKVKNLHHWKLRWHWKIIIFNRKYIFIHGGFSKWWITPR